jgi:site-specific recombinase XerD
MKTTSQAIPLFLEELRLAKRSPRTLATYRQGLNLFLDIVGAEAPLTEETYIQFLQSTSNLRAGTQITYRAAVCGLYEYHSPGIPMKLLNRRYGQKRPKRQIKYNEEAVIKVIQYMELLSCQTLLDYRDRAFIITEADTGMRISEMCALNRGDVDWQKGTAMIIGKGDKEAEILFSDRSLKFMKDYLAFRAELDGKSGRPLETLPLFARHDDGAGQKVKRVGSKGMWAAICGRILEAGCVEHAISPHKFRDHFVTTTYRDSKDIVLAKELARHEDIATTDRYTHLARDEVKKKYRNIFNKSKETTL